MFRTPLSSRLLCIQLAAVSLASAAVLAEGAEKELVVTSVTAEIKSGTTVLATVQKGQRIPLGEVNGDWYRVQFERNGKTESGWLHKNRVRLVEPEVAKVIVITATNAEVKRGTNVLGTVIQGERFPLGEVNGEWYRIRFERDGKEESGWIHKQNMRIEQVQNSSQDDSAAQLTPEQQQKRLDDRDFSAREKRAFELYQAGQHGEAIAAAKRILAISHETLGNGHPITAKWASNLGVFLYEMGNYAAARPYLEQALEITRKVHANEHLLTATSLINLGMLAKTTGDHSATRTYFEEAIAIRQRILSNDHSGVAEVMKQFGRSLFDLGDYEAARPHLQQSLAVYRKIHGNEHPDVAYTLGVLGLTEMYLGNIVVARGHIEEALKIDLALYGEEHRETATQLNNLGRLMEQAGDYPAARRFHNRSLAIRQKVLGDEHADTAQSWQNIGLLHLIERDFVAAKQCAQKALAIRSKVYGSFHTLTAQSMEILAGSMLALEDQEAALVLHEELLRIYLQTAGENDIETAFAMLNYGGLLASAGKRTSAREHVVRGCEIVRKLLPIHHPDTHTALSITSSHLLELGGTELAATYTDESRRGRRYYLSRLLPALSRQEQLQYLKANEEHDFHSALRLGASNPGNKELISLSASWLVNGKAVAHEALAQQTRLSRESVDPMAAAVLQELETVRSQLARQSLKAVTAEQREPHRKRLAELEAKADRLTRRLGQLEIDAELPDPWVELDAVRARIPVGSVLIEMAHFDDQYTVWIIPAAGTDDVRIVDLGEAEAVEAAVKTVRTALERAPGLIRTQGEPEAEEALRQPLEELSDLILRPLLAEVGDAKQLILSPDAHLWLVPWSSLPVGNDKYAVEDYEISFVVSGRDLVTKRKPLQSRPPLILADPDFGPARQNEDASQRSGSSLADLPPAQRLPATAAEAQAIRPQIAQYAGQTPTLKTGADATEAAFRAVRRPEVLTLSTHGFFLPDQEVKQTNQRLALSTETRRVALTTEGNPLENPLLRCGLLLAGCNQRAEAKADEDDGVLTGLEIVDTDLRGTKLVVLSACETGLGDVRNGEGVAGLRQAFQLAGAESIVATLWQVPDRDTARLMVDFFDQLAAGRSRSEALRNAQLSRIRSHRERYGAAHPFFWAAVTLTGEWK